MTNQNEQTLPKKLSFLDKVDLALLKVLRHIPPFRLLYAMIDALNATNKNTSLCLTESLKALTQMATQLKLHQEILENLTGIKSSNTLDDLFTQNKFDNTKLN